MRCECACFGPGLYILAFLRLSGVHIEIPDGVRCAGA